MVLSIGVRLHIFGWSMPILFPYAVIKHIPFFTMVRAPSRFIVYVYLFLSVIVAFALKELIYSCKRSFKRDLISAIIILPLFLDYYSVCINVTKVFLPASYQVIRTEEEAFGILNLPADPQISRRYMMEQTLHGFPIAGGELSRRVDTSLIDRLETKDFLKQKAQLAENRVKYIIIHKELPSQIVPEDPEGYRSWYNTISRQIREHKKVYRLIYEDERSLVFKVY